MCLAGVGLGGQGWLFSEEVTFELSFWKQWDILDRTPCNHRYLLFLWSTKILISWGPTKYKNRGERHSKCKDPEANPRLEWWSNLGKSNGVAEHQARANT